MGCIGQRGTGSFCFNAVQLGGDACLFYGGGARSSVCDVCGTCAAIKGACVLMLISLCGHALFSVEMKCHRVSQSSLKNPCVTCL